MRLILAHSSLLYFCPQGVLPCSLLQSLECDNSLVHASNPDKKLDFTNEEVCVASSLSMLTALFELESSSTTTTGRLQHGTSEPALVVDIWNAGLSSFGQTA